MLKRLFLFALAPLLAACAATPVPPPLTEHLSDGVWAGYVETTPRPGHESEKVFFALFSCAGEARYYMQGKNNQFFTPEVRATVDSRLGLHDIRWTNDSNDADPSWVERQSLTLIEIDEKTARVQWTRAVDNRLSERDDPSRSFFEHGTGTFERRSKDCPEEAGQPSRSQIKIP